MTDPSIEITCDEKLVEARVRRELLPRIEAIMREELAALKQDMEALMNSYFESRGGPSLPIVG